MKLVRVDRILFSEYFEGGKIEVTYGYDYISGTFGMYTRIGGV